MTAAVSHINLLQRSGPLPMVATLLAATVLATLIGMAVYGGAVLAKADDAARRHDEVARQLASVQARIAALNAARTSTAAAQALRLEIDRLKPQALAAEALVAAVRGTEGGPAQAFARPLEAVTQLSEPGLWLTSLSITGAGKLDLQGEAHNGAAVLRFARRVNDSLQPLGLRLDTLELSPAAGPAAGAVQFRLN